MSHTSWFLLLLVVTTCFYTKLYHDAITETHYVLLDSYNGNLRLDLKVESKDLKECMMTLPEEQRMAIYTRHRKELAEKMFKALHPQEPSHQ